MPRAAQYLLGQEDLADDQGVRLNIQECTACGVIQLDNAPVPYWREVIRAVGISASLRRYRAVQFADFVARHGLAGKAGLELGCGDGAYLRLLEDAGLRAYGLEYAPAAVERCRSAGLKVHQGYLEKGTLLPEAPFDAFFIFSWLEHLPSIPRFLEALLPNLAETATGIVEVPNFDMILKDDLVTEFIIDHLYYFTESTFRRTLEMNGLDVLSCRPVWHDYVLSAEVRKRPSLDAAGFLAAQDAVRTALQSLYGSYPRIALWGAGHQALTMIAMAGGADRLAYIVDAAPFKQGRFAPVTHLPIVPPDTLRTAPVDALIVATGSYSEEVCATARSVYGVRNLFVIKGNSLVQITG